MGFAPVQRTITRHTNDPKQMTVDLQLGGAPLAGSGRRHADGGERGDDARRGIWEYRTSIAAAEKLLRPEQWAILRQVIRDRPESGSTSAAKQ
jgi:hypothetical protein